MNSVLASEFSPPLKNQGCLNTPCSVPYFLPSAHASKLPVLVHLLLVKKSHSLKQTDFRIVFRHGCDELSTNFPDKFQ